MTIPAKSIENRVAIVTGGAKGIGQAIARRFGLERAKVVVADIDADGGRRVADEIVAEGGRAIALATDVSDEARVASLFDSTLAEFGKLDILVNNAGLISPMKHFLEADKQWWDMIVGVNLTGTFLCSLKAAHIMSRQGSGSIINLSSGGATRAHRCFVAYDATKGGIEAMSRAMALDLGVYGVRVNILTPGSIDTTGIDEEGRKLRGENIPLGRIGEPADMTGAAVFLASDDASYITGQSIIVDGGMLSQQRSATVDIRPPSQFPSPGGLVLNQRYRVGADIGGTFTDVIVVDDETGEFAIGKVLTTPDDPSRAVESALATTLESFGVQSVEIRHLIHGTTLVTNAMIERKGRKRR